MHQTTTTTNGPSRSQRTNTTRTLRPDLDIISLQKCVWGGWRFKCSFVYTNCFLLLLFIAAIATLLVIAKNAPNQRQRRRRRCDETTYESAGFLVSVWPSIARKYVSISIESGRHDDSWIRVAAMSIGTFSGSFVGVQYTHTHTRPENAMMLLLLLFSQFVIRIC